MHSRSKKLINEREKGMIQSKCAEAAFPNSIAAMHRILSYILKAYNQCLCGGPAGIRGPGISGSGGPRLISERFRV